LRSDSKNLTRKNFLNKTFYEFYRKKKGFNLVELLIIITVLLILSGIGFYHFGSVYKREELKKYAGILEYFIKEARMYAIQKSVNVGLCVSDNQTVQMINMNTQRGDPCSGEIVKKFSVEPPFIIKKSVALNRNGLAFDPRGTAIYSGNICIQGNDYYYKFILSTGRAFIRKESASGTCD